MKQVATAFQERMELMGREIGTLMIEKVRQKAWLFHGEIFS